MGDIGSERTEGVPRYAEGRAIEALATVVVELSARVALLEKLEAARVLAKRPHLDGDTMDRAVLGLVNARLRATEAESAAAGARSVVETLAGLPARKGSDV